MGSEFYAEKTNINLNHIVKWKFNDNMGAFVLFDKWYTVADLPKTLKFRDWFFQ